MRTGTRLAETSPRNLLKLYSEVMRELRDRGMITSWNNPVGDLTEALVVGAMGLERLGRSAKGFDARDTGGIRYQIKGRRITQENPSRQLSNFRDLDKEQFDYLVVVFYDEDFTIGAAYKVEHAVVRKRATYYGYINAHRWTVPDNISREEGVEDITKLIESQLASMEFDRIWRER